MSARTPLTLISGPLGSGKTTLLRHLLDRAGRKLAILMNEFGELAIDSRIIEGQSIRVAELAGGCVCCSLLGEFEAAVNEIIETVAPDQIVVETTGVAEPGALVSDLEENLPRVRLDGVVAVMDADGLLRFPALGHTTRSQIESADLILLNKTDLVAAADLPGLEAALRALNPAAPILRTQRGVVDPELVFGLARRRALPAPEHVHQPEFEAVGCRLPATLDREAFERFVADLPAEVHRAKGFVRLADGCFLFNFVNGRWALEPFDAEPTGLVFIGRGLGAFRDPLLAGLEACTLKAPARTANAPAPGPAYEFVEELTVADLAFRARGATLDEVFLAAAEATLAAMIENPQAVAPQQTHLLRLENETLELLLFDFLNELLYHKDAAQLLLRVARVRLEAGPERCALSAEARGEPLDPTRHQQRVDVKAVTLHQFKLERTAAGWEAQVVLDV